MIELRNKRLDKGLTQKQVADSLGVEPNTISQWESGVRRPGVNRLPELAQLLECTVDELLGVKKTPVRNEQAQEGVTHGTVAV